MSELSNACRELLDKAKQQYGRADAGYRDAILAVGRLLHEFIRAFLAQGDTFNEKQRLEKGITRREAMFAMAKELNVTRTRVHYFIQVSQVAALLTGEEGLGELGLDSLRRFAVFVQRLRPGGNYSKDAEKNPPSLQEVWALKPKYAAKAKALFRQAVRERMNDRAVRAAVREVFKTGSAWSHRKQSRKAIEELAEGAERLARQVRMAAPGDVAEMCLDLIQKAEDPAAVAIRLRVMLERFLPKKAKAKGA